MHGPMHGHCYLAFPPSASGKSFSFAPWAPHHGRGPAPCCTILLISIPTPPSLQGFSAPGEHFMLPWTAPTAAACRFLAPLLHFQMLFVMVLVLVHTQEE